jgi:hypothetical protein
VGKRNFRMEISMGPTVKAEHILGLSLFVEEGPWLSPSNSNAAEAAALRFGGDQRNGETQYVGK